MVEIAHFQASAVAIECRDWVSAGPSTIPELYSDAGGLEVGYLDHKPPAAGPTDSQNSHRIAARPKSGQEKAVRVWGSLKLGSWHHKSLAASFRASNGSKTSRFGAPATITRILSSRISQFDLYLVEIERSPAVVDPPFSNSQSLLPDQIRSNSNHV